MLERLITNYLKEEMELTPAVALLGARQVGKTTLARLIANQYSKQNEARSTGIFMQDAQINAMDGYYETLYLDLESPADLAKLTDATKFLHENSDKLIILDEIQRVPDLFGVLRGVIDNNRLLGKEGCQFLLLGSASMDLLRQSSESLAGRISYVDMSGLNVLETGQANTQQLWLRGGFPNSYLAKNEAIAMRRIENLVRTYLERDIPQMGFNVPAARLRRLWTMLAHLQGETVNYTRLAGNLEVDRKTINHYIDILIDLLLVRRVDPWYTNVKKRLVKSPRYYVRDSGILHRLLGISDYYALLSNPILGKSWEGFVIENIHSVLPPLTETYFYRTAAGAEIDLVIKLPNAEVWAVEIKHGVAPKLNKHYSQICDDVAATHKFVVYSGDDEFPIGDDVRMIALPKLMKNLISVQA